MKLTDEEYLNRLEKLNSFQCWLRWFRIGRCQICGKWSFWILKSEDAHEECWLSTK